MPLMASHTHPQFSSQRVPINTPFLLSYFPDLTLPMPSQKRTEWSVVPSAGQGRPSGKVQLHLQPLFLSSSRVIVRTQDSNSLAPSRTLAQAASSKMSFPLVSSSIFALKPCLDYHSRIFLSTAPPQTDAISISIPSHMVPTSFSPWFLSLCIYSLAGLWNSWRQGSSLLDFQISIGTQARLSQCSLGTLVRWEGSCLCWGPHWLP